MNHLLGFRNTSITVGVAFLLAGAIKLAARGTLDADLIVGAVFLVLGLIIRLAEKKQSE